MRLSAAVLATTLLATAAGAREVGFPLLVDHALLRASLARQLGEERDGSALVWGTRGSCRSLVLSDLRGGPAPGRVRITAQVTAHLGFRFLGFCFAPLSWKGNVESVARPASGGGWRLRLRELDSHLYDTAWRRAMVASRLWDVVKGRLESELTTFAFDLAPPVEEVRGLIRASVEPARARPVLEALATLRPLGVDLDDEGVKVQVALDLPPEDATPSPPEPPLAPIEVARWQQLLESWDGLLVFVVKNLGVADADPRLRDELLDLLLAGRYRLLDALAGGPVAGVDPVRQLFLDAWERLRGVVRESVAHGGPQDRLLRYASFVAAGDALAALDAAAPSLGLEISTDGLRRLARVLDPSYAGDPLAYTEAPDPVLRELFHFHEPPPSESSPAPPPAGESGWLGPRAACASPPPNELGPLARRLDRWLPRADERPAYRDAVARLLALVAERTAGASPVAERCARLYRVLVAARGRSRLLGEVSGGGGGPRARFRPLRGALEHARARAALQHARRLDPEVLHQLAQLAGHRLDLASPRLHRLAAARQLRVVAAREALLDGVVAAEERLPGGDVAGVDAGDVRRARRVAAQALEVCQDARPAVGDLPADLRLVHELRGQDARDGAVGLGLDRRPALGAREISSQLDASGVGRAAAGEEDAQHERRAEAPAHGASRNWRTPRRKTASWSWWTQCPARSTVMRCGWRKAAACPSASGSGAHDSLPRTSSTGQVMWLQISRASSTLNR